VAESRIPSRHDRGAALRLHTPPDAPRIRHASDGQPHKHHSRPKIKSRALQTPRGNSLFRGKSQSSESTLYGRITLYWVIFLGWKEAEKLLWGSSSSQRLAEPGIRRRLREFCGCWRRPAPRGGQQKSKRRRRRRKRRRRRRKRSVLQHGVSRIRCVSRARCLGKNLIP